jgi:hypothetical protein
MTMYERGGSGVELINLASGTVHPNFSVASPRNAQLQTPAH